MSNKIIDEYVYECECCGEIERYSKQVEINCEKCYDQNKYIVEMNLKSSKELRYKYTCQVCGICVKSQYRNKKIRCSNCFYRNDEINYMHFSYKKYELKCLNKVIKSIQPEQQNIQYEIIYEPQENEPLYEQITYNMEYEQEFEPQESVEIILDEQQAIVDKFNNTDNHIMVQAIAGSGKTTTCGKLMSTTNKSVLYITFNAKNEEEAKKRFKQYKNVQCLTTHKFLGRLLDNQNITSKQRISNLFGKSYPTKVQKLMEQDQIKQQIKKITSDWEQTNQIKKDIQMIITRCKSNVILFDQYDEILEQCGYDQQIAKICQQLLQWSIECDIQIEYYNKKYNLNDYRDFDDDLYLTAIYKDKIKFPALDIVICDEAQDFNKCQMIMLQELEKKGSQFLIVGDPKQAIYQFRGGCSNSMDIIRKSLTKNVQIMGLKNNYRCRQQIIQESNNLLGQNLLKQGRYIGEYEGSFNKLDNPNQQIIQLCRNKNDDKSLCILSKTNYQIIPLAFKLLSLGLKFKIIGKEIISDTISAINKFIIKHKINKKSQITQLINAKLNQEHPDYEESKQMIDMIKQIQEIVGNQPQTIEQFLDKLQKFNQDNSVEEQQSTEQVLLSTVHKSKGFEFNQVIFLEYLTPLQKWNEELNLNIQYIGLTRTIDDFYYY